MKHDVIRQHVAEIALYGSVRAECYQADAKTRWSAVELEPNTHLFRRRFNRFGLRAHMRILRAVVVRRSKPARVPQPPPFTGDGSGK
jgi:hypothetical protein